MIRPLGLLAPLLLFVGGCGAPADAPAPANDARAIAGMGAAPQPQADIVRVRLETELGPIVLALDARHAPVTTANFLAYVDQGKFDGVVFYRASRTPGMRGQGFIQGGIRRDATRMLLPIAHEPTSRTGLSHGDGAISMARTDPGSATGDFFITAGPQPSMDAGHGRPADNLGYAAFGRVVEGREVVRRILAAPTVANAGRGAMRGQMIEQPVRIVSARRAPS
ncbi:MAG: peptidyl-prolyl cis-trans isomerase [Sphingomonadales bacterium]|jgi:peptidyl-prolyl cis-trans isomerase A (cyclophilin A)|nr:peptidyl-prolyl cis-trans isomerase [Sphingomonadales bacterium]